MNNTPERLAKIEKALDSQNWRAIRAGAEATLKMDEWTGILDRYEWNCAYCRTQPYYAIEHLVPIHRGGGTTKENCVPSCRKCNASKGLRIAVVRKDGTIVCDAEPYGRGPRPYNVANMPKSTEGLLSLDQLAGWLGVSNETVKRWRRNLNAKNDPLPVIWMNGKLWFSPKAIEQFIQDHLEPDTIGCQRSA